MKPFLFLAAKEGDLDFISRLARDVFSKYGKYDEIVPVWFLQPGVITEIIVAGGDPLGFAMLALEKRDPPEPRGAHLLAIAVSPAHQGKGVGSALLNHMQELARTYRVSEMHLWTAHDNLLALPFFRKAGFEIRGSEARYYPRGQAALAMSKKMKP
jgi:ribosomal protein S18 acetylase RimI-like enzyme